MACTHSELDLITRLQLSCSHSCKTEKFILTLWAGVEILDAEE